ncbi:DUF4328 domain-containing protein [Kitasatospora sp. NPDC088134]|uniref:DUF4328 domain-containing protein n=1 Tax=Kitasatospora sp. NPDC088134 TaxID=3364071 RepID=UPI0038011F86
MPSPAVYKSPRGLATASTVLLGLSGIAALVSAAADAVERSALSADEGTQGPEVLVLLSSALQTLLLLGTAAVFVSWLYRARVNAEVIRPYGDLSARGWSIGAWFVPIGFLFLPWQVVRKVWRASVPTGEDGTPQPAPEVLVHSWWIAFAAGRVLSLISNRTQVAEGSVGYHDSQLQSLTVLIVANLSLTVAAVLAILVVRRLTAMQQAHAEAAHARAAAYWAQAQAV